MRIPIRFLNLCLIVLVFACLTISAQTTVRKSRSILNKTTIPEDIASDKIRIYLSISSKSDSLKNLIQSYISRELKDLKDVKITESDTYDYALAVIGMERTDPSGFIMSVAVIKSKQQAIKSPVDYDAKTKKYKFDYLKDDIYQTQYLYTGSFSDLKRSCDTLVADLDSEQLKNYRETKATLKAYYELKAREEASGKP